MYSKSEPRGDYFYTDDTAMARQLADSLAEQKCLNERDLAKRFTEEFFSEPNRGYGGGVIDVFRKLRKQDKFALPLQPAREQFNGTGSYGNGAAMRVHPVALGCNSRTLFFQNVPLINELHNLSWAKIVRSCVVLINDSKNV